MMPAKLDQTSNKSPVLLLRAVDARDDLVSGDTILWTEDVFRPAKRAKWEGRRKILGVVETGYIDGSEGPVRIRIKVTASGGYNPVVPAKVITREAATLQRGKVVRELTDDEDQRAAVRAELGKQERERKWAALTEGNRGRTAVLPAKPPAIALKQFQRGRHKRSKS